MTDSLELRIEITKSLGNFQFQLLKSFYNGYSISENYLNGCNIIHVHGLFGNNGFCATYLRSNPDRAVNDSELPVLVWVGDRGECLRPFTSTERLQPLDSCNLAFGKSFETTFSLTEKHIRAILDKKLRAIYDILGIKAGQLINEVIESGTQVIDNFANKDTKPKRLVRGWDFNDSKSSPFFPNWRSQSYSLCLYHNTIQLLLADNINPMLQVNQVFACPTDPLISAIQRVHMLYFPYSVLLPYLNPWLPLVPVSHLLVGVAI